jgi:hypothetical protein
MTARGFALVDTPPFFDDDLFYRLRRTRTVLSYHSKRWWQFPQLACYACWLEEVLHEALAEEAVSLASLEFRHEQAGSEDREVDRLHADGSYVRSVCTLHGPATVYRVERSELPVPVGHSLLITGMERARSVGVPCTLHRRPGPGPERTVVVCSFEPRSAQPQAEKDYREVAQAHRGRGHACLRTRSVPIPGKAAR